MENKKRRTYYTDGVHEIRVWDISDVPAGWHKGRVKSTATTAGCKWITNGVENLMIFPGQEIPDGYHEGRSYKAEWTEKQRNTMLDKENKWFHSDTEEKLFSKDDVVPEGWLPGRLEMSNETRSKISQAHIGVHQPEEVRKKISMHSNNNREKAFETIINNYGSVKNFFDALHKKGDQTKAANHAFNTSNDEKILKKALQKKYGMNDVFTSYKCERYPFRCDFYIKSQDLFIELNAHWTHGFEPFDPNNQEHKKLLEIWKEKAKTSKFYENAIDTWTIRDPKKIACAKENNLNYTLIYSLKDYLNTL